MRNLIPLFALLLLVATSCTFYEPEFRGGENFKLNGVANKQVKVNAGATVYNPNGYALKIKPSTVDLYLNDKYMGKVRLEKKVKMKAKKETDISAPLTLSLEDGALMKIMGLVGNGGNGVKVGIKGQVKGGVFLFSKKFDVSESITLSKEDLQKFRN